MLNISTHRFSTRRFRQLLILAVALIVALGACGSSAATVDVASDTDAPSDAVDSAGIATVTPIPTTATETMPAPTEDDSTGDDPTADDAETAPAEPTAVPVPVAPFESTWVTAIDPSGTRAWLPANQTSSEPQRCDRDAEERLVSIDLTASDGPNLAASNTGYVTDLAIGAITFRDASTAAFLLFCDEEDWSRSGSWLQVVSFGADGRVTDLGVLHDLTPFTWIYDLQWASEDVIQFTGSQPVPAGDPGLPMKVVFNVATGATESSPTSGEEEDRMVGTSLDNVFTYTSTADPDEGLGCEAAGLAQILQVDDGTGPRPAIRGAITTFSYLRDFAIDAGGLATWTDSCEGYTTSFLGRVTADGSIVDVHWVDWALQASTGFDSQAATLSGTGDLIGIGYGFSEEPSGEGQLEVRRWDAEADPDFVNSGPNQPTIDTSAAIFTGIGGTTEWFSGTSKGPNPGCDAMTIYKTSPDGFSRLLFASPTQEMDRIVDIDAAEVNVQEYEDFDPSLSRVVVFSAECPDAYEGRRLYSGVEGGWDGRVFATEVTSIPPVAEVLSVSNDINDYGGIGQLYVEVLHLDGTTETIAFEQSY